MPTCWIISGPNGAGKTTFALEFLPAVVNCQQFINADLIAAGLSPFAPERELISASRLFLKELKQCISKRQDFAFETTLSGRSYLRLINQLRASGWKVELIYLALPSVTLSKMRVAERVSHGGHNIAVSDIERRFPKSLSNLLQLYSPIVDQCQCYLNIDEEPVLVFEQYGTERLLHNKQLFNMLIEEANNL
jgi:predicted ABC-type ATPase